MEKALLRDGCCCGGLGSAAVILLGHGAVSGRIWLAAILAPATLFFMLGTNLLVGLKRITAFNAFFAANLFSTPTIYWAWQQPASPWPSAADLDSEAASARSFRE